VSEFREGQRPYCLVVDDSPTVRRFARKTLEGMSIEVEEAENGSAALKSCTVRKPDLILLDWNMPIMNGIEFLSAFRSTLSKSTKIIFCTTEVEVARIREALEKGADQYIMKPFDSAGLVETVEQVLAAVVSRN
jgi:two-component system chemotaxis response regulator CheY